MPSFGERWLARPPKRETDEGKTPSIPQHLHNCKIPGSGIYRNRGIVYFFRNTSSLLPT